MSPVVMNRREIPVVDLERYLGSGSIHVNLGGIRCTSETCFRWKVVKVNRSEFNEIH